MTKDDETYFCEACKESHDRDEWQHYGLICSRCKQHTGNSHQGHYWGLCKKLLKGGVDYKSATVGMHFCCPTMDCELDK